MHLDTALALAMSTLGAAVVVFWVVRLMAAIGQVKESTIRFLEDVIPAVFKLKASGLDPKHHKQSRLSLVKFIIILVTGVIWQMVLQFRSTASEPINLI